MPVDPAAEERSRILCQRGKHAEAATLLVRSYGTEISSFLQSRLRHEADADDVFSQFLERLWKGLPGFEWRSSARTWCYTLARHAADSRHASAKRRREAPLSLSHPDWQRAIDMVRTQTRIYQRTQTKDQMRELRQQLSQDEQALIILRVDRKLDWRELAQVMLYDGEPPERADLDKDAVRLRKRFQLAKDKLRQLAVDAGLFGAR